MRRLALICFVIGLGSPLQAQATSSRTPTEQSPVSLEFSQSHSFHSAINGRDYIILVALPPGYSPGLSNGDTTRYPVLYLADGNISVPLVWSIERQLAYSGDIKHVILVGIAYPTGKLGTRRMEDYSPTTIKSQDSSLSTSTDTVRTGGAAAMLKVLREEIIPLVEKNYRVTADRALLGVSMGGLFASYALLEDPTLFKTYAIGSPSLWWDQRWALDRERDYATRHSDLPARVLVYAGEREGGLLRDAQRFASALRSRNYPNLRVDFRAVPDADHSTSWHDDAYRTLRALYAPTVDCVVRPTADTLASGICSRDGRVVGRIGLHKPLAGEEGIWRGRMLGRQPSGDRPFVVAAHKTAAMVRTVDEWYPISALRVSDAELAFSYDPHVVADPTLTDLSILARARALLSNDSTWRSFDDGEVPKVNCAAEAVRRSLFCALYDASREIAGEFDWGRPAVAQVREAIASASERPYDHALTGFNRDSSTTFAAIQGVFDDAIASVRRRIRLSAPPPNDR